LARHQGQPHFLGRRSRFDWRPDLVGTSLRAKKEVLGVQKTRATPLCKMLRAHNAPANAIDSPLRTRPLQPEIARESSAWRCRKYKRQVLGRADP
jgi:hypothetical protein